MCQAPSTTRSVSDMFIVFWLWIMCWQPFFFPIETRATAVGRLYCFCCVYHHSAAGVISLHGIVESMYVCAEIPFARFSLRQQQLINCFFFAQESQYLHQSLYNLEVLCWCLVLGVFLLRFMTLGSKINKKYRNLSVLITEQVWLRLRVSPVCRELMVSLIQCFCR